MSESHLPSRPVLREACGEALAILRHVEGISPDTQELHEFASGLPLGAIFDNAWAKPLELATSIYSWHTTLSQSGSVQTARRIVQVLEAPYKAACKRAAVKSVLWRLCRWRCGDSTLEATARELAEDIYYDGKLDCGLILADLLAEEGLDEAATLLREYSS